MGIHFRAEKCFRWLVPKRLGNCEFVDFRPFFLPFPAENGRNGPAFTPSRSGPAMSRFLETQQKRDPLRSSTDPGSAPAPSRTRSAAFTYRNGCSRVRPHRRLVLLRRLLRARIVQLPPPAGLHAVMPSTSPPPRPCSRRASRRPGSPASPRTSSSPPFPPSTPFTPRTNSRGLSWLSLPSASRRPVCPTPPPPTG